MAEEKAPRSWIGKDVVLRTHPQDIGKQGRLQDVSAEGIVLFQKIYVSWLKEETTPEERRYGDTHEGENRWVSLFYPWRSIYSMRELEEEEKRDYKNLLQEG